MEGDGQQMSIMLCMNTNFPESTTLSKTNLSNSLIDHQNKTINLTTSTNITNAENEYFNFPNNALNSTNNTDLPIVEPAETPSPTTPASTTLSTSTTPSPSTPAPTTQSPTTPSPTSEPPVLDTSTNLRGKTTSQNTTNNSDSSQTAIAKADKQLEEGIIVAIILCICVTIISITTLIIVLCKHKKCCEKDKCCQRKIPEKSGDDVEAQESLKKPKGRRVSPTNEKIEHLQYTNTYRNSQNLKQASTTLNAVRKLKHFRENRGHRISKKDPSPPSSATVTTIPKGQPPPPANLPPPAPVAMKQAQKLMERKNRNSWSIKEISTNANNGLSQKSAEVPTDKIIKTNGSHNLGQSK